MKYLSIIVSLSFTVPALADAQEARPVEIGHTISPQSCPRVSTAGLSSAVAVSSFGLISSLPLLTYGAAGDSPMPGMVGAGAALAAVSIASLVASAIYLKRKKEKKRAYQNGQCEAPTAIVPGIRF